MKDLFSREDRIRTPIKGLRAKLRIALKANGVTAKFRTDHLRNGTLLVISKEDIILPFDEFNGYKLKTHKLTSN